VFAPERGVENPIIRRAMELCDESAMRVIYHEDAVEVWFAPDNKRVYTTWSQFLADAEMVFGAKLHEAPETPMPFRPSFGQRSRPADFATAEAAPLNGHAGGVHASGGHANGAQMNEHLNGHAEPAPPPQAEAPPSEVAALKRELKVLERAIRVVGMQSEEWKREAEAARRELETARAEMANMVDARLTLAGTPDRYKSVRQIIVKRLHPDIPGSVEEKSYREKMFKSIWQDIEALDRRS